VELELLVFGWSVGSVEVCPVIVACLCSFFFKAPSGIVSSIESIFNTFFLRGSVEHRKITWIDWNSICRSQEVGGLGVRRIRDFNVTLLGKWCWRLLVDSDSLWFRVLSASYGVEDGRVCDSGRAPSAWWQVISTMRSEEWFRGNVSRSLGDGKNTHFWTDVWVGGVSFNVRFNRLYELAVVKSVSVHDMYLLGWGRRGRRGVGGVGCLCGKRSC
jgi:hypothetical protein